MDGDDAKGELDQNSATERNEQADEDDRAKPWT